MTRETPSEVSPSQVSLTPRQVFFVFFGLSVVGCLLFTLGVVVGRNLAGKNPTHVAEIEEEAEAPPQDVSVTPTPTKDNELAFREGIKTASAGSGTPPSTPTEPAGAKVDPQTRALVSPTKAPPSPGTSEKQPVAAAPSPAAGEPPAQPDNDGEPSGERTYTLQLKGFTTAEEAEKFAESLRQKGHAAKAHIKEENGKTVARVIVGNYTTWDDAVSAKQEFEQKEKRIAYVIRTPK